MGLTFARWSERWFPDPLVFALLAVALVFAAAIAAGEAPAAVAVQAGKSFWTLVPFTMQMAMVVVSGYAVASAPIVSRCIAYLARLPKTPRGAVAFVALFSTLTSLLSWGLSLVFSGHLVRALARNRNDLDYRAASAAAYLGLGVTWALGLSSSAAMLMATPSSLPPALATITGVIPLSDTLFLWQNGLLIVILISLSVFVAFLMVPSSPTTAADLKIGLDDSDALLPAPSTAGERLGYSPGLTLLVGAILVYYIVDLIRQAPRGLLAALDLNTYNLIFITAGLLLHWRPASFLRAVSASVPAAGGVLIQFPFYAMIFGMIVNTGLSAKIAGLFVRLSTPDTYTVLVAAYSTLLGVFIPSGGTKWVIEAPYVMQAALTNHANLGWIVQVYNAAEALPNLINPFWMLPLLGIVRCKARDLVGYGMLQLLVLLPICYALCWLLARTF